MGRALWPISSMPVAAAWRSCPARSDMARAAAICAPIVQLSWSAGLRGPRHAHELFATGHLETGHGVCPAVGLGYEHAC